MKWLNVFLGLVVIAVGLFPFFEDSFEGLSKISSGSVYNGIVIVIGIIILVVNLRSREKARLR
ncbi:MAG: hypothetical protein ABIB47_05885 [Candidatus Woesearchaeota archaeon]